MLRREYNTFYRAKKNKNYNKKPNLYKISILYIKNKGLNTTRQNRSIVIILNVTRNIYRIKNRIRANRTI
jgi:hypothetical protein